MEKNMQLTDLQKTYCLGMHPASFLGGKYPFLYVSTKISQFEKERFDRALDAVVRNNTLLHCQLHTETEWVKAGLLDEKVVAESGAALTVPFVCGFMSIRIIPQRCIFRSAVCS